MAFRCFAALSMTMQGRIKISARPERVEGFRRKSGLIRRRYGSTSSPRTAW